MKAGDFLICKFKGDVNRDYVADITSVTANSFTCKFVHSGSIYEFETTNWTVISPGETFPVGTPLTEHKIYKLSDDQNFPMPGSNESKLVCVTFEDNNRYLGQLTQIGVGLERFVTFLHSGSKYIFGSDNVIIDSGGGAYEPGKQIKTMEIYAPAENEEITFTESEGEQIESTSGALHIDWRKYFEDYTMDEIQSSLPNGKEILQNMVDTTVRKAKLISHAFANPVSGEDLAKDSLEAGFYLISGDELDFVKKATKAALGGILGSFIEILRANEAREVSAIRRGLYSAYIDGCFSALFPDQGYSKPEDSMEKQFYEMGSGTVGNLSPREDLKGNATYSEFMRADLLIALVESYRLRPGALDETYDLDDYKRSLTNESSVPYGGFKAKLITNNTLTDD